MWKASPIAAGMAFITALQAGNANYKVATNVVRTQVVKAAPTQQIQSVISFSDLPEKIVGDAPFTLSATSNNGEAPITFASSNSNVVSLSNNNGVWKATLVGPGSASITALQGGSITYLAAADVVKFNL